MKELTIEEKAKAYDKALTESKKFLALCKKCGAKDTVDFLERIFPELKESEDEKVRKAILELVKQSSEILDKQNQNNMIAWLEKQGEKPQGKSALEAIKEEKVDNANKVEPKDYSSIDPHFFQDYRQG